MIFIVAQDIADAESPLHGADPAAVVARDGRTWCVLRDGEATRAVAVIAGPAEGGRIPVLDGLGAGQRVVTAGAYELLYRDLNQLFTFED
jgi:hypothetical protein